MPIYACKCRSCGHRFEDFARMADRKSIRCPICSTVGAEIVPAPFVRDRVFHGSECESMTEGFHPNEVGEARQLFKDHQHCIKDDGTVVFSSRSEQRSYMRRKIALRQETDARAADSAAT